MVRSDEREVYNFDEKIIYFGVIHFVIRIRI